MKVSMDALNEHYIKTLEQENEKLQAQVALMRYAIDTEICSINYKRQYYNLPDAQEDIAECQQNAEELLQKAMFATASSDAWMKEQKAKWLEEIASKHEGSARARWLRGMASELRSPESDVDQATRLT